MIESRIEGHIATRGAKGFLTLAAALLLALALAFAAGPAAARCGIDDADCGPPEPEPLPPTYPANGEFEWSLENRFGQDEDRDGVTDYHWNEETATYAQSYVNPTEFKVNFDGCPSQYEYDSADTADSNSYTWEFGDGTTKTVQNCRPSHPYKREGTFTAKLTYRDPATNANVSSTEQITVQDHLIVSLGDSYGSGEGAVDRPIPVRYGLGTYERRERTGTWPIDDAKWVDKRCHRSANAGAAQAARALEYSDPHSTVTFISFACSGATINRQTHLLLNPFTPEGAVPQGSGLLGKYRGIEPPPGPEETDPYRYHPENWLPPQVDALARTLAGCSPTDSGCENGDRPGRHIDSLVISGGGNDAYFADIVTKCMLESDCNQRADVGTLVDEGLGQLPARYDDLTAAIHNANPSGRPPLSLSKVYLTQYPDPTTNDDGLTCGSMLGDIIFSKSITRIESLWARSQVIGPLNQTMSDAVGRADAHSSATDWEYVDGISEQFVGHGYCANSRWIMQPMDSRRMQGPYEVLPFEEWEHTLTLGNQKGMMHPNAHGYRAYSNSLVPLLRSQLNQVPVGSLGPLPTFNAFIDVQGATSRWGENGWIVGAMGAGSTELNEAAVTVAVEDPSGMASGSVVINGVNPCTDTPTVQCSVEDVGAQRKEWRFRFREDGIHRLEFVAQGRDGQSATYVYEARVDLNDPEATAEAARPPDEGGRYTSPVDVTLRGMDRPGGSGVFRVQYTVGDGPVQELASGDKVSLQPNETRLRYWAVDHAGRKSAVRDFIPRDRVAFSSSRGNGRYQIWGSDIDGSHPVRLTDSPTEPYASSFSPDGKKIVYQGLRDGNADIYVMNADGTGEIRLTDHPALENVPVFSPDGKSIAFSSRRDGNSEVYVMNADGTNETRLTTAPQDDGGPAYSPDGSKIVFASLRDGNPNVYTMNADGTSQTRLTDSPASDIQPAYSPDGKKITFATSRDGNSEIYTMNADGTSPTRLTNTSFGEFNPVFSSDGKRIAYDGTTGGNIDVYAMNADGTGQTRLTTDPAVDERPDFGLVYNDDFARSRVISGSADTITGSTYVATRESGEPVHSPNEGGFAWPGDNSVWYRWTAPASGTIELDLCETNFDTILSVYTGGSPDTLRRVANNNNACPSGWGSKLTFEATSGTVYNIGVSGAGGARAGIFTLKLGLAVDRTPPAAPVITYPTNNPLDRDGVFTIVGTAEPNSTIRLREGEEFKGGARVGSGGTWSARLTGISDGQHTYVAEATDNAGNVSQASNPANITVDSTPPETAIESGPSGWTKETSADFVYTSEPGAKFECRLIQNDAAAPEFVPCGPSKDYSGLEQSNYTFEVRAVDAAGNPDPTPAERGWTVDTVGPAVDALSPRGGTKTKSTRPTIKATVLDGAPLDVSDIALFVDGKLVPRSNYVYEPATGAFSYRPKKDMKPGRKTVRLVATDEAANEGTATWSFIIKR